jgi:transglutaminase-like putative cysteine protease
MTATSFDLTVRAGCHITYEVSVPTPVLFMLRPRPDGHHLVTAENRSFEPGLPAFEFPDAHGNIACRSIFKPGRNDIRLDALVSVSSQPEPQAIGELPVSIYELPTESLRYTLPSRYCDSDKLLAFAWDHFGQINNGYERVQAICNWVHDNIEYRYGSTDPSISASDVVARRYGVCRDFAHVVIALCRTFNIPARYVTGHLPEIGAVVGGTPEDFHAYCEVYLGHQWFTFDARFNTPRIGRIKLSHGLDAVDGAFATIYGEAQLVYFEVWTYQVNPKLTTLLDPIDLSKRLDGTTTIRLS